DRILVVTFTIPATAELARRIRERIDQLARVLASRIANEPCLVEDVFCRQYGAGLPDPAQALALLRVARARIDEASVRTIHGFCQRVISEHALSIGQARGLEPQANTRIFHERLAARWWRENLLDADHDLMSVIRLGGVTHASIADTLARIAAQPAIGLRGGSRPWREAARRYAGLQAELRRVLDDSDEPARLLAWLDGPDGIAKAKFRADVRARRLAALRRLAHWEGPLRPAAICAEMNDALRRFSRGGLLELGAAGEPPGRLPALCDEMLAVNDTPALIGGWMAIEIWAETAEQRWQLRREAGALGFDDLLAIVHRALCTPGSGERLAAGLRERYPLALIDECQDTDPLQWEIFRRIYLPDPAGEGKAGESRAAGALVLVGDPKQAIYGFRGADIFAYLDARGSVAQRHALAQNQRSSAALIGAVNSVFAAANPFLIPEIGFAPAGAGQRAREAFTPAPGDTLAALTFVHLSHTAEGMLAQRQARRVALDAMSAEIARLLSGGARIAGRAVQAGDIAVLVNSHHEASAVKARLARDGIGAAEISRASVLEARECSDLLRWCAAIADPSDAGRLIGALATGLAGGDARSVRASLADPAAWAAEVDRFTQARQTWLRHGSQAALRPLLIAQDTCARLGSLTDGERRLTNLSHLLELLGGSDEAQRGPQAALRWLMRLRADPAGVSPETLELRLESTDDLVRIATVHKSKGLEYPFVLLPFAWSGRGFKAASPLRYHEPAAGGRGWQGVLDFDAPDDSPQALQAARESYAETLRVLYVALTRARFRCYVFWGAAAGAQFSPLAWLLHGLDPVEQKVWRSNATATAPLDDARILAGLQALRLRVPAALPGAPDSVIGVIDSFQLMDAARAGGAGADAVPGAAPGGASAGVQPPLRVRSLRRALAPARLHLSFTAMAARLAESGAARADPADLPAVRGETQALPDRDDLPEADPARPAAPGGQGTSIRDRFPAGALAGTCLHAMLERADFSRPLDPALAERCLSEAGLATSFAPEVATWLTDVLATPLPGWQGRPLVLGAIPSQRQVRELEFLLPAERLDNSALFDAVAREFPLARGAAEAAWSGFLRGFIDLIVEDQGRWWIVDWKSNRLGDGLSAYGPDSVERSVAEHAYALQFCLYSLALHRLLSVRLPGYQPATHFGGVFYLYLRGVSPGAAAGPGGARPGVYAARPSDRLLARMDSLFTGAR
ncbi:MAG TPA: UvrD-helicase domain-containing protein, partial [Burkholderiaceae bacterium]|nr:UvrD-helicase domain-containing protein [Burkholderiaceae bacterium]